MFKVLETLSFGATDTVKKFRFQVPNKFAQDATLVFHLQNENNTHKRNPRVSFSNENRQKAGFVKRSMGLLRIPTRTKGTLRYNANIKNNRLVYLGNVSKKGVVKGFVVCPQNSTSTCKVQILVYSKS
jgi:hypothetical protein